MGRMAEETKKFFCWAIDEANKYFRYRKDILAIISALLDKPKYLEIWRKNKKLSLPELIYKAAPNISRCTIYFNSGFSKIIDAYIFFPNSYVKHIAWLFVAALKEKVKGVEHDDEMMDWMKININDVDIDKFCELIVPILGGIEYKNQFSISADTISTDISSVRLFQYSSLLSLVEKAKTLGIDLSLLKNLVIVPQYATSYLINYNTMYDNSYVLNVTKPPLSVVGGEELCKMCPHISRCCFSPSEDHSTERLCYARIILTPKERETIMRNILKFLLIYERREKS